MLLVAVDIEGCAAEVIEVAATLAAELNTRLTIVTALVVPAGLPASTLLPGSGKSVREDLRDRAVVALEDLAAVAIEKGVQTQTHVYFGPPQRVVLDAVRDLSPRFLVLGTHARTGVARWVFGSVEESITRRCPVPVLVVPAHDHSSHPLPELDALRTETEG